MKEYIGTRRIQASYMTRLEYNDFRGWVLPNSEDGADCGFMVRDIISEHVSWLPENEFHNIYKSSGDLTFGDAIHLMKKGYKLSRKGWNGNKLPPKISDYPKHIPKNRIETINEYTYIKDSKDNVAVIDSCLLYKLNGQENFVSGKKGYLYYSKYENNIQTNIWLHHLLFDCPDELFIDHINGNVLDNRAENIRFVTKQQNTINRKASSGDYKGVSFDKSRNKYISSIQVKGKTIHIGRFDSEEECAKAYDKKAYELYGEYARLNFPNVTFKPRMYIQYFSPVAHGLEEFTILDKEPTGTTKPLLPFLMMKTADDMFVPWLASHSDMLSSDWCIYE